MSRSGTRKPVGGAKKGASDRKVADHPSMVTHDPDEFALPETLHIIPDDQVKLTPKEMEEDITRVMTGNNPQVPSSMVVYNFVDREYKGIPGAADEHIAVHLHVSGAVLHTELSEEGSEQKAWERNYKAGVEERRRDKMRAAQEEGKEISDLDLDDDLQRNQFNFTERAAQTYVATTKTKVISTEPPHTTEASGSMSQWRIYDAYMAEFERLTAAANAEKAAQGGKGSAAAAAALAGSSLGGTQALGGDTLLTRVISQASATYGVGHRKGPLEDPMHSPEMRHSLQIMERLISQNAEDEVYSDFKYWEDASDAFRDNVGTCLPLWKFEDARTKKASKQVTAIAWNQGHHDLFAVGYGSYDMLRQGGGMVQVYSLKNVGYPEYSFACDSGVMCLDFHPTFHALLAVGCYDGTVRIYDIRRTDNKPVFAADIKSGKHSDPVWEVKWAPEGARLLASGGDANSDPAAAAAAAAAASGAGGAAAAAEAASKDLMLYSISSDGQVASWVVAKSELKMETAMLLKLASGPPPSAPGAAGGKGAAANGGAAEGSASGGAGAHASAPAGSSAGGGGNEEEGRLTGLASGCCFAFNPFEDHVFLVGTEEGRIHKCSLDYAAQYLATYEGHNMAVYSVRWNHFHPRVFLSASADWTVRLWDETHMAPIMVFDLGTAVGDVAWAPYSSSVFAAVTDEGKVNVYDLHANKHEQLCEQKVVKKAKCTHVAFSTKAALLLVGDSNGGVISLKLSPNLRRITPIPQMAGKKGDSGANDGPTREEVEIRKMDRLLALSDAKITIVTPIPGKGKGKGGAAKGGAAAGGAAAAAAAGGEGGGDGAAAAAASAASE